MGTHQDGGNYVGTDLPQAVSSATYNAANQLTQWGTSSLTYDANGNLTSDGVTTYTWNARNQLASLGNAQVTASFRYDAFGRRVGKTVNGVATDYLFDGANPVQELSGGTPTANVLTGLGVDEYLTRTDATGTHTFLTDALGSTVALADSAGSVQTEYTYDPFGNTTASGTTSANAFQFTGRENDGTGLYYYRARYYNPVLQRFISEDPIGFAGGDTNLYAYVWNSPTNYTDPSGNVAPIVAACAGGAAFDAVVYAGGNVLAGRKVTVGGVIQSAGSGCVSGVVGFGVGKALGFIAPRVLSGVLPRVIKAGCSFSAETEVATEDGPRAISTLKVGDRVLAYDEETGTTGSYAVTAVWAHQDEVIERLTIDGEQLETTPEHPFFIEGKGWVPAGDLQAGDRVREADGEVGVVEAIAFEERPQPMYNLTVDEAHTYFVGDQQWLVHNSCPIALPAPIEVADHHIIPAFRGKSAHYAGFIRERGIDVDQYTVTVAHGTASHHWKFLHGQFQWNQRWMRWIDENPHATAKDIFQFAGRLMDEAGLSGLRIHPYGQP